MSKKSTLADVQRITGLSRATIDRVVNRRAGVKSETRRAVQEAMAALGYKPRSATRPRSSDRGKIRFLVSSGSNPFFDQIAASFEAAISDNVSFLPACEVVGFNPYEPETLIEALKQSRARKADCVVLIGVDTIMVRRKIRELVASGCRVVVVMSDVPNSKRHCFIGQSSYDAGRTAGAQMCNLIGDEEGSILAMIGSRSFRHLTDRVSGFQQVVATRSAGLRCVMTEPYFGKPDTVLRDLRRMAEEMEDLKGIYFSGGSSRSLFEFAQRIIDAHPDVKMVVHETHALSVKALEEGYVSAIVSHDLEELSRKAIKAALSDEDYDDTACSIRIYTQENITGSELF